MKGGGQMGIETLMNNPDNITFSVLFVGLLVWVIKTNDTREKNYRSTIEKLTKALGNYEDVKNSIVEIKEKLWGHHK